jgi:hypothetical protein
METAASFEVRNAPSSYPTSSRGVRLVYGLVVGTATGSG